MSDTPMERIHIVFDGPPGPESGRFVEVEDDSGKSIRLGEWEQHGDYWHLVIPNPEHELAAAKALIAELEQALAILRDSECDKIMTMSDEQVAALSAYQGHNPDDEAKLGKMALELALLTHGRDALAAELEAARRDAKE